MKKLFLALLLNVTILCFAQRSFTASFYSDLYHGRKAADGSIFNQNKLTAASNIYKLGTLVTVKNKKNGKSVTVKITDRLAKNKGHRIDLSKAAFKNIADLKTGLVDVEVHEIKS